jgi:hypothetical protein
VVRAVEARQAEAEMRLQCGRMLEYTSKYICTYPDPRRKEAEFALECRLARAAARVARRGVACHARRAAPGVERGNAVVINRQLPISEVWRGEEESFRGGAAIAK